VGGGRGQNECGNPEYDSESMATRESRVLRAIKVLRILKIIRLLKLVKYFRRVERRECSKWDSRWMKGFKIGNGRLGSGFEGVSLQWGVGGG
jgi:hypothetical protein